MEKEENVCVKTEGTEESVCMESGVMENCSEKASTVPSKFKDVDALARAYAALQSEFTRRSQRLKELERRMENLEGDEGRSGVEKLRKNAQARKAEMARFDRFVAETEGVTAQAGEKDEALEEPMKEQPLGEVLEAENAADGGTMDEVKPLTEVSAQQKDGVGVEERAGVVTSNVKAQARGGEGRVSVAGKGPIATPSESLYAQVCRDEEVRLRIIGEYLASLGKSGAPLMTGGVGAFTTPPFRAANIAEAGNMALLYFKKPLS